VKRISPSGIFNSTFILRVLIASTINWLSKHYLEVQLLNHSIYLHNHS
jgi:hypothetical protein